MDNTVKIRLLGMSEKIFPDLVVPDISKVYSTNLECYEEASYFSNKKFTEIKATDFDRFQIVFYFCPDQSIGRMLGCYIYCTIRDEYFWPLAFDRMSSGMVIYNVIKLLNDDQKELFREYLSDVIIPLGDVYDDRAREIISIIESS